MRKKFLVAMVVAVGLALVALPLNSAKADPDLLSDQELGRITAGQNTKPPQDDENGQIVGTQFNAAQIVGTQNVANQSTFETTLTVNREKPTLPTLDGDSGGAILGDYSYGTFETIGLIRLSDTVQRDVKAINVVNSAESGVANAVNVWAGRMAPDLLSNGFTLAPIIFGSDIIADQMNVIAQNQARSASLGESSRFDSHVDLSVISTRSLSTDSSIDTNFELNIMDTLTLTAPTGSGAGGTGAMDFLMDEGSVSFDPDFYSRITGGVDVLWGLVSLGTTVTTDVEAPVSWDLPDFSMSLDGAGCAVNMGSCTAVGSDETSFETVETLRSVPIRTVANAKAEYIVGDNATINVVSDDRVILSGSAQQNAKAINLVNAASSSVANGVNVAATMGLGLSGGSSFNLSQTNMIIQRH